MDFIIIPFGYEQLSAEEQRAIVPIFIASTDRHDRPIARVWFEKGVAPVAEQLRRMARRKLGDVYRVSELAEVTVHKLWERHGEYAGICPWRRVVIRAYWEARDLAAGSSRWRIRHTVPLAMDGLERDLYKNGIADPTAYDELYQRKQLYELIKRRIVEAKRPDIQLIFQLLCEGHTWGEIALRLNDPRPEAVKKRFWRWIDRHVRFKKRKK